MLPYLVPLVAGLFMLGLAGVMIRAGTAHRAGAAFAFVLVARGLSLIALSSALLVRSTDALQFVGAFYPSFCFAAAFGVFHFLGVYPRRRGWLPQGWLGPLLIFGPMVALLTAIAFSPSLVTPSVPPIGTGPQAVIEWIFGSAAGPLGFAPTLLDVAMTVPALFLAREYLDAPEGKQRGTLLMVSLGFFTPAACSCLMAGALLRMRETTPRPDAMSFGNYMEMALFGVWFLVLMSLLGYLVVRGIRARSPRVRLEIGLFVGILLLSTTVGALTSRYEQLMDSVAAIYVMVGFWSALGASLVAYGVLRYSLFEIDVRFRVSVQRGSVVTLFLGVGWLVSEVASVWFSSAFGSEYWGVFAAAFMLLMLRPIQRIVERMVDLVIPQGPPLQSLDADEQDDFYREHVGLMWMDGQLTPKDRIVLASLRSRLGLAPERAEHIELEVLRERERAAGAASAPG